MKIESVSIGNTGNGPCIEVSFSDDTYICLSNIDGTGMPEDKSWVACHLSTTGEVLGTFNMPMIKLWRDHEVDDTMGEGGYAPIIIAKIIGWGCDSYSDDLDPEKTWAIMIEDLDPNMSLLMPDQRHAVKALFIMNVRTAQLK